MAYHEPLALIIISSISIGIAAIFSAWISYDILARRGWRSMMAIMIPVYIINALYLWPITLWTYLQYGRPPKPDEKIVENKTQGQSTPHQEHHHDEARHMDPGKEPAKVDNSLQIHNHGHHMSEHEQGEMHMDHATHGGGGEGHSHGGHVHQDPSIPMFATVTIGVCHCGAGCVLGDIIGEWLVYGTNAMIGNPPRALWVEFLVDFAFAFAFGIVFQYFSIAPMTANHIPRPGPLAILLRALKADTLSLLFFEAGLFGWMAAFQIGIFHTDGGLRTNTVTYWWMMQIGMFVGHWTGVPINWWLIGQGIKEPCV